MKTLLKMLTAIALAMVFAVALVPCVHAQTPTVTESLVRIQTDPPTGQVQAFFEKTVTIEGVAYRQPWVQVSWNIGAEKTVTVGNKTYTYAEVLAAAAAIAAKERAEQVAAQESPPPGGMASNLRFKKLEIPLVPIVTIAAAAAPPGS